MSTRGWTQADVDAYRARQSGNALKNAHTASGAASLVPHAEKPQTPAHAKSGGTRGPNKTEERFNREMLGGRGVYEGLTFRLPGGSRYTPDWIYEAHGQLFAVEVKGAASIPVGGTCAYRVPRGSGGVAVGCFRVVQVDGIGVARTALRGRLWQRNRGRKKIKKGLDKPNRLVYTPPQQSHHRGGEGKTKENTK
jgi:hypothetical protein